MAEAIIKARLELVSGQVGGDDAVSRAADIEEHKANKSINSPMVGLWGQIKSAIGKAFTAVAGFIGRIIAGSRLGLGSVLQFSIAIIPQFAVDLLNSVTDTTESATESAGLFEMLKSSFSELFGVFSESSNQLGSELFPSSAMGTTQFAAATDGALVLEGIVELGKGVDEAEESIRQEKIKIEQAWEEINQARRSVRDVGPGDATAGAVKAIQTTSSGRGLAF